MKKSRMPAVAELLFCIAGLFLFAAGCRHAEFDQIPPPSRDSIPILAANDRVEQFAKFEVIFSTPASYSNAFDPGDISVDAEFTSPSGIKKVCPAFLYSFSPAAGAPDEWRVRFSPDEKGPWQWRIMAATPDTTLESKVMSFDCIPSERSGPLRVAKADRRFFEHANGAFYYPIGHNVCWNRIEEYREQFELMARHGENWSRVWVAPWNCEIEWSPRVGAYRGLGLYNLDHALKLDGIMEAAEQNSLYIQLVLHEHCRLSAKTNPEWQNNPYSAQLGGPCAEPKDFFVNEEARRLARNRLRYIVARWGYSAHLMAWELFNEVDLTDEFSFERDTPWHKEMAEFLKKTDPHGHMVTTSYVSSPNADTLKLPVFDYTQSHVYAVDLDRMFARLYEPYAALGKPHFIGEFGRHTADGVDAQDLGGSVIHAGLWAQFMIPSGGNAMSWWWYDHIHPHNLYPIYSALNRFSKGIDRRGGDWVMQTGLFKSDSGTRFNVMAMAIAANMVCWIYDPAILPWCEKRPEILPGIKGRLQVESVPAGTWAVEQWDTYKGTIVRTQDFNVTDGILSFDVDSPGPDTALKFTRLDDNPAERKQPRLVLEAWDPRVNTNRTEIRIPSLTTPITVDGDLGDWSSFNEIQVNPTDGSSAADSSFSFKAAHDGTNLFVAVQVSDDHLVRQNSVGGTLWKDDCIELWVDSLNDAGFFSNTPNNPGIFQFNIAPGLKDGPADQVVYRNPKWNDKTLPNVIAQSRIQKGGFVIEVKIPLPVLRGRAIPKDPRLLGFNVSVCDSDPADGTPEWRHLLWQGEHEWDAREWSVGVLE